MRKSKQISLAIIMQIFHLKNDFLSFYMKENLARALLNGHTTSQKYALYVFLTALQAYQKIVNSFKLKS